MLDEIIIAGFGGQGILLMGRLIAYAGMLEGKHVAWMPSYGPEMRGGTANCTVIISSEEVASPVVPNPITLIAMNQPSLDKFEPMVEKGGIIIVNQSLISRNINRDDVQVVKVPANDIANELGNLRVANMVALGSYVAKSKSVKMETVFKSLEKTLGKKLEKIIELNKIALQSGEKIVTG
ncbi:MAG: 2-oxoacid:acceptor oxidoreductase family protein [Atribacterota bacterium]|nr:2-oxoacid:acceptor oxidoreductase family protein [Atribacterota bacterium]MDD4895520.1 2-oxoacid:acceptor oxidoreductase family protein [Atribacterota bacterium]MDD5637708.1 2-oxoacid:acceptor oxidoreductase family protein [Atribacterota bacterium]